jgi:hypothetical protein
MSLLDLTSWVIIEKGFDRRTLCSDLREHLSRLEFNKTLKKLKDGEEKRDENGFSESPFIMMLFHKHWVQINIKGYDKWYKRWNENGRRTPTNRYFPKIEYVLFYLKQEPNFIEKYP